MKKLDCNYRHVKHALYRAIVEKDELYVTHLFF
jgi:hypothetical protein